MNKVAIRNGYAVLTTADHLRLSALMFEPSDPHATHALIMLRGNGSKSILSQPEINLAFAEKLTRAGVACLILSTRGDGAVSRVALAHEPGKRSSLRSGSAYELIEDCLKDIDAAVAFLVELGYRKISIYGHSSGANKICVYNRFKPSNHVYRYILAGGSDDCGLFFQKWQKDKFWAMYELAQKMVAIGDGMLLIPELAVDRSLELVSWQTLLDLIDPDGPCNSFPFYEAFNGRLGVGKLFEDFSQITTPSLVIYGGNDEYAIPSVEEAVNLLKKFQPPGNGFTFEIIEGANHSFTDHEEELATLVADFLSTS